jgi:hypothetical protein
MASKLILVLAAIGWLSFGQESVRVTISKAEDLLRYCTSKDSTDRIGCFAYVNGVVDGHYFTDLICQMRDASNKRTRVQSDYRHRYICWPEGGVSNDQARLVVIKWLEDHPENLNIGAASQIVDALTKAFPCKP